MTRLNGASVLSHKSVTDTEPLVDDAQALAALVDAIDAAPLVFLDTEFVREQTYYPRLGLIQIATPRRLACVDCVADMDLGPLFAALLAPGRSWLLHSARQDLEVMLPHMDRLPDRLIDTQLAAGLLGYAPQIGLQDLLADVLDIEIEKAFTRTNWAARPLPKGALSYALDDVRHLPALWNVLRERLNNLDRLAWLEEDCHTALDTPVITPLHILWSRLKGIRAANTDARCAALALVEWREQCAKRFNRPRGWICSDGLLMRIAKVFPRKHDELLGIPEMPRRLAKRSGDEILSAIAASVNEKNLRLVNEPKGVPVNGGLKQLRDRARKRARELDIDPQVLATRKELDELLRGVPSGRIAAGWRRNELNGLV